MRFAACNALGQLSADFAPEFQRKYHSKVDMHECVHGVCVRACMHDVCAWCVCVCLRACMHDVCAWCVCACMHA